jgi:hypothetical protein
MYVLGLYTNPYARGSHPGVGEVQPQHKDQDVFHDYYAHIPNIVLACSCFLGVCQIMWSFIDDNLAYKIGQIARSDPDPQECAKWVAQYIVNSNKILYYLGVIMCDVLLAVGMLAIFYVVACKAVCRRLRKHFLTPPLSPPDIIEKSVVGSLL